MSILWADKIGKSFQGREILSGLSFAIDAGDRIGLIGRNGSGKSTLLKLMTGELEPDRGSIHRAYRIMTSMLDQRPLAYDHQGYAILDNPLFKEMEGRMKALEVKINQGSCQDIDSLVREHSRLQEALEAQGAYDYSARLARNLAGLGLTEAQMNQPYASLSGGEQMRVSLGRLLLEPGELLLLDEPTNHLDFDGLDWLQSYLLARQSALVLVSHDRWFLDGVCDRILELENKKLVSYRGNFSAAMEQKAQRLERLELTMNRLAGEIRRQEAVTQTMLSHRKMKSYHSREKVVRKLKDQMQELQGQKNPSRRMSFDFLPAQDKKDKDRVLIEASGLAKAFDRPLFQDLDLTLLASDKLALLGPNGCGKTTLLEILLGRQEADGGRIRLFGDPAIASMGQNVDFANEEETVYHYLASSFQATETAIRKRLAQFGFGDESMVKKLGALSGGERHRLHLCTLLEEKPDLLVLDEPTNHLDIESRRLLEEALRDFEGAVITVSHDRTFIGAVSDRVLGFVGSQLTFFDSYEAWFGAHKAWRLAEEADRAPARPVQAERPADLRRLRAGQREALADLEKAIALCEGEKEAFESSPGQDHTPSDYENYAQVLVQLEALYEGYFQLAESMEEGSENR